jgi:hypothetical protein
MRKAMSFSDESVAGIQHPHLTGERRRERSDPLSAESTLREEIRSIRELWMRILQWGITVITGASTITFYARRSIKEDLVASKILNLGDPLPLKTYFIGTVFLLLLAYIFFKLSDTAGHRYRTYVGQLPQLNSTGIVEPTAAGRSVWLSWIFFVFPMFDILLRIYNYEFVFTIQQ